MLLSLRGKEAISEACGIQAGGLGLKGKSGSGRQLKRCAPSNFVTKDLVCHQRVRRRRIPSRERSIDMHGEHLGRASCGLVRA
jgi:hypothetical protein